MVQLQERSIEDKSLESKNNCQLTLLARQVAIKLQIADNWPEILNQLNTAPVEFRMLVWSFWEFDVFGESTILS